MSPIPALSSGRWIITADHFSEPAARTFGPARPLTLVAADEWNPLQGGPLVDQTADAPPPHGLICWSGSPAESLFERDVATWSSPAWESFLRRARELTAEADRLGTALLIRPHARHVLSDVQRCVRFLTEVKDTRIGLALDPGALMENSMLPRAADHLRRALGTLGEHAAAVIVTQTIIADEPGAHPIPWPEAFDLFSELIPLHVPPGTPILLPQGVPATVIAAPSHGR